MAVTTFTYNGTVQFYTVTVTGTYDITGFGAQGGGSLSATRSAGGLGAEMEGQFSLVAGETLEIVVGGEGVDGGTFGGGGGGGGSFVIETNDGTNPVHIPLLIAGGGGGAGFGQAVPANGDAGQIGTSGSAGRNGGAGGTGGSGGSRGGPYGGGGGGYSGGNGASFYGSSTNGIGRGSGYGGGSGYGSGGFGGGGGGGYDEGGGGGGYSGGGGGGYSGLAYGGGGGGGGGSLDKGLFVLAQAGENPGNGSVVINLVQPCYCAGTLILTPDGEASVEHLKAGDRVVTISGKAKPIKWIGRRSYSGRFALGQKHILPICFKAGSIADKVPRRDLWISPQHAMYLDGMLIEAKDLVNGISVVQAEKVDKIEYFHIELDTHDVIVAEGALSESFIDDNSRGMFHNAQEYWAIHSDAPREPARYCAPRRDEGYEVEAARRTIETRAGLRSPMDQPKLTLRGSVDDVSSHCIAGWAQTVEYPEAPVCLDICAGGRLIGQVLANRYRKDLQEAGLGSGCHSFVFKPPAGLAFALDEVEVRRSLDGAILPLSTRCKEAIAQHDLAA